MVRELEKELQGRAIHRSLMIERAKRDGIDELFVEETLSLLVNEGVLWRPLHDHYKVV